MADIPQVPKAEPYRTAWLLVNWIIDEGLGLPAGGELEAITEGAEKRRVRFIVHFKKRKIRGHIRINSKSRAKISWEEKEVFITKGTEQVKREVRKLVRLERIKLTPSNHWPAKRLKRVRLQSSF